MNQIVFNSYPRSGNLYSGYVCSSFINGMFSAVHIPEIFMVEDIDNITIFRKPEDAISSLINKQLESSSSTNEINVIDNIDEHISLYKKYMKYAIQYKDLIYICKFDDLINDTVLHFENLAKWLERPLLADYKERFAKRSFTGKIWEDKYDGHVPRPKDKIRIKIENIVSSIPEIQDLNREYENFIAEYATKVN